MRRNVLIFLLITISLLVFCVHQVWTLLTLLFVTGAEDAISRAELPGPNSTTSSPDRSTLIPKIIHQTYKNETIPEVWRDAQKSCMELHEDYEYILWTDKNARQFIQDEYPWFLETFDGYPYPIQRADAIRYFVLAHYGGIYIDLDDGCQRRLDPLLAYPAWVRRTIPTGISNDAMGSRPQHPFFLRVIDELPKYDRGWLLPYITVMGSTGPLFLSVIWRHYNGGITGRVEMEDEDRVRVLFPDEYKGHSWSFFRVVVGNSWHRGDVKVILWVCVEQLRFQFNGIVLMIDRWLATGCSSLHWVSSLGAASSSLLGGFMASLCFHRGRRDRCSSGGFSILCLYGYESSLSKTAGPMSLWIEKIILHDNEGAAV